MLVNDEKSNNKRTIVLKYDIVRVCESNCIVQSRIDDGSRVLDYNM